MRNPAIGVALVGLILSACGGGGGGGGGGGIVTPLPPPPATNSSITNLTVDQTFTGMSGTSQNVYNLTSGTTVSGSAAPATLSVAYNAASRSYQVSVDGRTQTFGQAEITSNSNGETRFSKDLAGTRDNLTLVTTPYSGTTSNRYVGLGYWQRSNRTGDRQSDQFATFVYGIETPATAAPRTGRANFDIDVFGASTVPGFEPSVLQGRGAFDVDFLAGIFSVKSYLTERALLTGAGVSGGGIELNGAGLLSSGDASFSGNVIVGSRNATLTGSLAGRFFGPGAEELGATFSAVNGDGATAIGGFTGQRGTSPAVNLTLTNIVTQQLFYPQGMGVFADLVDGMAGASVRTYRMIGQVYDHTSGNFSFGPGLSNMPGGEYTTASIVASSNPNFTVYEKAFDGRDVRLELYKVGQANSELALTYVTLGRWQSQERNGVVTGRQFHHFVYGLETLDRLLTTRTGSARYEGVVYGAGVNRTNAAEYDVRGTSVFNVDFTRQTYAGDLAVNGRNGATVADFGRYNFAGQLGTKVSLAPLTYNGATVGELSTRFYGPTGEEIGGDFDLRVPESVQAGGTLIGGVTVARRQ
ncbi:transferrin-binding protein-like solute binding protein [Caulobacter sp. LARHSG274]